MQLLLDWTVRLCLDQVGCCGKNAGFYIYLEQDSSGV